LKSLLLSISAALLAFDCAGALAQRASLDTMEQRVSPCTVCHGAEGRATREGYYPRIAGKPAGYLYNQLLNFRDGRRHFPIMVYLTELQNDAYLREIAEYFAAERVPYSPPEAQHVDPAVLSRGRQLAMEGDPGLRIPPCRACHGEKLLGVAPAVPGLLGVSRDYLVAQLGAWRNGIRATVAPDCMAALAPRMRSEDVEAVTAWLASQAVPDDTEPDGTFAHPPPLTCGSIPEAQQAP
jgi:cytochrome c553